MILTMQGIKSENPIFYIWELLILAINDLVAEGLIEEEKLNSFNFPLYLPTLAEIKFLIEKDASFTIDCLEASQIHWTGYIGMDDNDDEDINSAGNNVAMCMRAGLEPMLVSHFGEGIIDELFHRYSNKIAHSMSTYPEKAKFTSVTVSMLIDLFIKFESCRHRLLYSKKATRWSHPKKAKGQSPSSDLKKVTRQLPSSV
ncbi:PREDICTED: salicylate carboxymethyltransferase-like [Ipomoea nil]|uniref:salicylate carboxymethyltransferase-like n=1 Tax=Ipomoea nil TaxID=35883 RepID=UPI000900B629|nr:PREDICTED: salicylate carboxymethyltransferase-like [Ipomoea nil]